MPSTRRRPTLNLIAVGYSLGLAASVLYFGAVGDRYGRKLLLILGMLLTIPADCLAAWAPTDEVLIAARILGGLAAGMAYPTTLALITALWAGRLAYEGDRAVGRDRRGDLRARAAVLRDPARALLVGVGVPAHPAARRDRARDGGQVRAEPRERGDRARRQSRRHPLGHAGRCARPRDQLRAGPERRPRSTIVLFVVAGAALVGFYIRQRLAANPLYDLHIAARPTFWVAACAGLIVFGSLMGAMFIGQQFLQNVLGYSTVDAGLAILPGGRVHGRSRTPVGEARRTERRPADAAHGLRVLSCSAS